MAAVYPWLSAALGVLVVYLLLFRVKSRVEIGSWLLHVLAAAVSVWLAVNVYRFLPGGPFHRGLERAGAAGLAQVMLAGLLIYSYGVGALQKDEQFVLSHHPSMR